MTNISKKEKTAQEKTNLMKEMKELNERLNSLKSEMKKVYKKPPTKSTCSEPKRGPGRPKKVQESTTKSTCSEPKRGPGRPKKVQESTTKSTCSEPKRGPGRPKKVQTQEPTRKTKTATKSTVPSYMDPIRSEIESEYMFHIPSYVIRSPGKFEGEMIYMPYYYGVYLEGGADEDTRNIIKIKIIEDDRRIFPELPKNKKYIKFVITDQGFVQQI